MFFLSLTRFLREGQSTGAGTALPKPVLTAGSKKTSSEILFHRSYNSCLLGEHLSAMEQSSVALDSQGGVRGVCVVVVRHSFGIGSEEIL